MDTFANDIDAQTLLNRLSKGADDSTTETLEQISESVSKLKYRLDEANSHLILLSTQVDVGAVLQGKLYILILSPRNEIIPRLLLLVTNLRHYKVCTIMTNLA
jgi:hypothetical protein